MSREKQIKEMAKTMCKNYGGCSKCMFFPSCDVKSFAMRLHENGYRKASDVAREVINTALSKIQIMISAIKALEESGNITEFNGGAKSVLEIVFKDLAELKKKYTKDGE